MKNLKETEQLTQSNEELISHYRDAIEIIDVKGDEYIEEHLGEEDAINFKELVDTIWECIDDLDMVDIDVIDEWNESLFTYLLSFPR